MPDLPIYHKNIEYEYELRQYAAYLDNELICFTRTYEEAEIALGQLVFELQDAVAHESGEQDRLSRKLRRS